jgi:hypothetical protein
MLIASSAVLLSLILYSWHKTCVTNSICTQVKCHCVLDSFVAQHRYDVNCLHCKLHALYVLMLLSYRCDIVPLCRGDLVIGPNSQKGSSSRLAGALAVVHKVTSVVQLIDPTTLTW